MTDDLKTQVDEIRKRLRAARRRLVEERAEVITGTREQLEKFDHQRPGLRQRPRRRRRLTMKTLWTCRFDNGEVAVVAAEDATLAAKLVADQTGEDVDAGSVEPYPADKAFFLMFSPEEDVGWDLSELGDDVEAVLGDSEEAAKKYREAEDEGD